MRWAVGAAEAVRDVCVPAGQAHLCHCAQATACKHPWLVHGQT